MCLRMGYKAENADEPPDEGISPAKKNDLLVGG